MVLIPVPGDPTLAKMREMCEIIGNRQERRDYLGASLIGDDCTRKVWYDYNGYEKEPFSAKTLWAFERGHREEDVIINRLRLVPGVEVWTHDKDGKQFGFSDLDGRFRGHVDGFARGILQAPKTVHVLEVKSCGQKKFDEFQRTKEKFGDKDALKNWNLQYWVQGQIYMLKFKLERHYCLVGLAGASDIDSCRTEFDRDAAEFYLMRAKNIIGATEPPPRISEKPDFWRCRFCDFAKVCHG